MTRSPVEINQAYDRLREHCDPRGHGLLDAMEKATLTECAMLTVYENLTGERRLEFSLPDEGGHSVGSPKLYALREAGEL